MSCDGAPAASRGRGGVHPAPLSQLLNAIAADTSRERISITDLLIALQDRALAALLLIFALPNVIPVPPGTSALLGAPLLFLAAQLAFGMRPWLPRLIAERSMPRAHFAALITRATPWLARAERLLRPRWSALCRPPAEYLVGAVCLLLSLIVFLPIPLGNMLRRWRSACWRWASLNATVCGCWRGCSARQRGWPWCGACSTRCCAPWSS